MTRFTPLGPDDDNQAAVEEAIGLEPCLAIIETIILLGERSSFEQER